MTAIGMLMNRGGIVLVSDLMVSRQGPPAKVVDLPLSGSRAAEMTASLGRSVSGSVQKVSILRENVAIAVAGGNAALAAKFLEWFHDELPQGTPTAEQVVATYEAFDLDSLQDLEAVIICVGSGGSAFIPHNCTPYQVAGCVEAAIGSGAATLENWFWDVRPDPASSNPVGDLLGAAFQLMGKAVAQEIGDSQNFKEFWGGGYEITYWNGKRFRKYSDIFVFEVAAIAVEDGEFDLELNPKHFYQTYSGDDLLLFKCDNEERVFTPVGTHHRSESINFAIPLWPRPSRGVIWILRDEGGNMLDIVTHAVHESMPPVVVISDVGPTTTLEFNARAIAALSRAIPGKLRSFRAEGWSFEWNPKHAIEQVAAPPGPDAPHILHIDIKPVKGVGSL